LLLKQAFHAEIRTAACQLQRDSRRCWSIQRLAGEDGAIFRFAAAATLSNFIRLAHNLCATVRKIDIRFICKAR